MQRIFSYFLLLLITLLPVLFPANAMAQASVFKGATAVTEEMENLENAAGATTFSHWSETIIPGEPDKGRMLYSWFMVLLVLPVFGILLVWSVIQSLNTEGFVDYGDIIKRLILFAAFTGFSSVIFAYLSGIQTGMSRITNFVQTTDLGALSDMMYAEDATSNARLKRNITAGIEDARNSLLSAAKAQVRYNNYQGGETVAPFAIYMMFPMAAYNEGIVLQDSKRGRLPATDSCELLDKVTEKITTDLSFLPKSADTRKAYMHEFASSYARVLEVFTDYPTAGWKGEANMKARKSFQSEYSKLYSDLTLNGTDQKFDKTDDAPYTEVIYSLLGKSASKHRLENSVKLCKELIDVFVQNPLITRDINLLVWSKYHDGDTSEVENLAIDELSLKMDDVTKVIDDNKEPVKLSLGEIDEIRQEVCKVILDRAESLGILAPATNDGKTLAPNEWVDTLINESSWWDTFVSGATSLIGLGVKAVTYIPSLIFGFLVDILDYIASFVQRLIVFLMNWVMAIFLSLQFFFVCLSSCMLGSKKTEPIFYSSFKVCLTLALIPFTCNLFIAIFNMLFNSAMEALIGPPGYMASGSAVLIAGGAQSAATIITSGGVAMLAVGLFCALLQIVAMVFLAIYSIKAAKILIQGGSVAGALAAVAGGAIAAGTFAAKVGAGMAGVPAGSSIADKLAGGASKFTNELGNAGENENNGGGKSQNNDGDGPNGKIPTTADPSKPKDNGGGSDKGGESTPGGTKGSPSSGGSNDSNGKESRANSADNKNSTDNKNADGHANTDTASSEKPSGSGNTGSPASSPRAASSTASSGQKAEKDKGMSLGEALNSNKLTAPIAKMFSKGNQSKDNGITSRNNFDENVSRNLDAGKEKIKASWPNRIKSGVMQFNKTAGETAKRQLGLLGKATWNATKSTIAKNLKDKGL